MAIDNFLADPAGQTQILVLRLRVFDFALETGTYNSGGVEMALPWATRSSNVHTRLQETYLAWMHSQVQHSPWDVVFLPSLIIRLSQDIDWELLQKDLSNISSRCSGDEESLLGTIAILDSWCEALLRKAWRLKRHTDGPRVISCVESCIGNIQSCLDDYLKVATDISPSRYQVRLSLFRRDFWFWKLMCQGDKTEPLRTSRLDGEKMTLWRYLELAEAVEDFQIQYQCLVWLSLELKPAVVISLPERGFNLWKLTGNKPLTFIILKIWLTQVGHSLPAPRLTRLPALNFSEHKRSETDSIAFAADTNFLADPDLSVTWEPQRNYVHSRYTRTLRRVHYPVVDFSKVVGPDLSGIIAIANIYSRGIELFESVSELEFYKSDFYWWNTHGFTDVVLAMHSYMHPHHDSAGSPKTDTAASKRSIVFKLTAAYLPPAAIAALKLTCRMNFETIAFEAKYHTLDECGRSTITRHLEESREAPLRYRCACCKALYPAHMFKQLTTPYALEDGAPGRVCKWHLGRYSRIVGRLGPRAWLSEALGMMKGVTPWNLSIDLKPRESAPPEQLVVYSQAQSKPLVESIEKVCMHCGKVQAWEPCSCNCESCWYRDVPCTTSYVDDEAELLKGEGVARVLD